MAIVRAMAYATQEIYLPHFLDRSPWLWPLRTVGARLPGGLMEFPSREQLSALYATHVRDTQPPLRFVAEAPTQGRRKGPGKRAVDRYDGLITLRHEVPTRTDNWHDLLNALCFATYPRAKRAIHRRQYRVLTEREPPPGKHWPNARTREQDALTLLDEGGIVIAVQDRALCQQMRSEASPAFVQQCCSEGRARIVPFGHAVLEHLVKGEPCPGGRACCLDVAGPLDDDDHLLLQVDSALQAFVDDPEQLSQAGQPGAFRLVLSDALMTPRGDTRS